MSSLAFSLQLLLSTLGHPGHVSMAEVEYLDNKLEVAMQVDWRDLETLSEFQGLTVKQLIEKHFVVLDDQGEPCKMNWLGTETEIFRTWLYFEIHLEGPLSSHTMENSLFFDLKHNGQINTVQLKLGSKLRTLSFTAEKSRYQL